MFYFMCNDDIAIHDTLTYNILKYVNIQKQGNDVDMTAEPYFFATTEQYVVYILLDLFTGILFIYILTIFIYILLFCFTSASNLRNSTKIGLKGNLYDFDSIILTICFIFIAYIIICIIIYKFIFSNQIHANIYNIKQYYNSIDL